MSWARHLALLVVLTIVSSTTGQSTNVTKCVDGYQWAFNSKNQNPCLVAAYLESTCLPEPLQVPAIPIGNHYTGPTFADANPCFCSSVVYSLVSACGGCQGRNFQTWDEWIVNCPFVEFTSFPNAIPAAVEVPSWAYLNLTLTNNTFDAIAAQNAPSTTTGAGAGAPSSTTTTTSPNPTTESKGSSHAGAIAGGVIGGVVFVTIVAIAGYWFFVRRHHRLDGSTPIVNLDGGAVPFTSPPQQMVEDHRSPTVMSRSLTSPLYESSEMGGMHSPVTSTSGVYTTYHHRGSVDSVGGHIPMSQGTHGYTGAPEV